MIAIDWVSVISPSTQHGYKRLRIPGRELGRKLLVVSKMYYLRFIF